MHKLVFALAAIMTIGGGLFVRRAWQEAACPTWDEVLSARELDVAQRVSCPTERTWKLLGDWPEAEELRVDDWEFFDGDPAVRGDLVLGNWAPEYYYGWSYSQPRAIIARPVTALARLRVLVAELLGGWEPPPIDYRSVVRRNPPSPTE